MDRIRSGVERRGFHIFDRDELAVVWRNVHSAPARVGSLRLLARECAAVIDPESHCNAVRFNAAEAETRLTVRTATGTPVLPMLWRRPDYPRSRRGW